MCLAGGGGVDTRDLLGERSDRAFARAFEDAQQRAVRDAIDNADFSLARDEAQALHDLRSTAAKTLETEGERYLAELQADHRLEDTLNDIGAKELSALQDIKAAEDALAVEILKTRQALEENVVRREVQAGGAVTSLLRQTVEGEALAREEQALRDRVYKLRIGQKNAFDKELLTETQYTNVGAGLDRYLAAELEKLRDKYAPTAVSGGTPLPIQTPRTPIPVEVTKLPTGRPIIIQIFNDEYQRDENTIQVVQNALNGGILHVEAQDAF